ncbi:MAG: hypothetical protein OXI81_16605 [Paracoccaceae bacterium]|nr:hypothetical protein [Paracoccaceae bacterium]
MAGFSHLQLREPQLVAVASGELPLSSAVSLEDLRNNNWIEPAHRDSDTPYFRYKRGPLQKNGATWFATPSGKIELDSARLWEWGTDPLPMYVKSVISPVSTPDLARKYSLILKIGSRTIAFFHSEHRMVGRFGR